MMSRPIRTAGFTLLEAAFAVALLGIVSFKVTMVLTDVSRNFEQESRITEVEDQARTVLERIALVIQGSSREQLDPDAPAPNFSNRINYTLNLGVENGQVVWSDPERIGTDGTGTQVVWEQDPGGPDARSVVWIKYVRPLLEGEVPNGIDDNGNGLIDETGLSFAVDRSKVTIRLTLQRQGVEGQPIQYTVETEVTCRN